jgi:hypothetical protein
MVRVAGCLVLISGVLAAAPATAAPGEVEQEINAGLDLREKGQDREALEHFQKAYELSKGARALAQMSLAEQALGLWVDAESHLKLALDSKDDKWIRSNRQALEGALSSIQRRLGSLEILGNATGAEVRINGVLAGTLPLSGPVRTKAGTAQVDVTADGYYPVSLTVTVPAMGLARETVNLVMKPKTVATAPESKPKAQTTSDSSPPTSPPSSSSSPSTTVTTAAPSSGGGGPDALWAYVAGGGAVAGLALGLIEMIVRNGHINNYNNDAMCLVNGKTRIENCGNEKSAADSAQTVSTIGFVAGGALAVGAVVLFVLAPTEAEAQKTAALPLGAGPIACGAGPGLVGIACGGSFGW